MSNKLEVIKNQPDLFKKFKKALERGRWLSVSVILCKDCIEAFTLPLDHHKPEPTEYARFSGYTKEALAGLNTLLDARAKTMKGQWAPHFQALNSSEDDGWSIDISKQDYAVLEVGKVEDLHRYRLAWSYDGLSEAADYLSRRSNTVLDGDD